jgi:hypothetical protein
MRYIAMIGLLCLYGCSSNSNKCEQFRTGNFLHYDEGFTTTYRITRTDSLHTETNQTDKTRSISRVVWINDCEYDLYKIHSDKKFPMTDSLRGKKPMHIVITETTDDYYLFTARIDGIDLVYSDTIFKIN